MKEISILAMGLLLGFMGVQAQASTVYEGFAYTSESVIPGQGGTSNGWNGAWTDVGTGSSNPFEVISGQTFGALEETGGAAQRPDRGGKTAMYREISSESQSALTADGSTVWFSVLMNSAISDVYTVSGAICGTIAFGDASLEANTANNIPTISAGGNAVGVGFNGLSLAGYTNCVLQGVCYTNGTAIQNDAERITVGVDNLLMVVGKIEWAATGSNDTVTLYNVSDPTAELTE
ncbi:hypothetical protein, partial [Pontiella sp.]|uniref:hypothetical protein n=1 Tax=Pontiella sp. TaxID=2837462 RepID=UPI00356A1378